jgi:ABC-type transport system involved in resistance to organic solvents, ATPase component
MTMLELKDVSVHFGSQMVFEGVNLRIEQGESFVIIGPSGQGKTTLLKTLCGLLSPQNGEVFVEQKSWLKISDAERFKLLKKMGVLFQKNALFDSLTCGENIAFPLRETTTLSESEITAKVEHFLDAVGLPHARDLYPDEISGGMQKRLGIARALALEPEIIFYDDPTAGLDPITSRKIINLILDLKAKNKSTIVAVVNDMNRAYQLADRIGMIVDKSLLITGTPDETRSHLDGRVRQFVRGETQGPLLVQG